MSSHVIRRAVLCSLIATAVAVTPLSGQSGQSGSNVPAYALTATVPLGVNGYTDLDTDPTTGRAFLAIRNGMRVLDLSTGRITEPLTALETSGRIVVAPEIGRVFAEINDDYIGFIDSGNFDLDHLVKVQFPDSLMYEPASEELYVFSARRSEVEVFNGRSGEHKATVELPGWGAEAILKTPGRIWAKVAPKSELYVIDTGERLAKPFPLPRAVQHQPSRFEVAADTSGETLFVSDDYEIVAVDTSSGAQLSSVRTRGGAYLMYDEAAGALLARVRELDWPEYKQVVYRFANGEFDRVGEQNLPQEGGRYPFATAAGFVSGYTLGGVPDLNDRALPPVQKNYVTVWTRAGR